MKQNIKFPLKEVLKMEKKYLEVQKVNIPEIHMKLLVELKQKKQITVDGSYSNKQTKGEKYSINNVSERSYEKNNKDTYKGSIGAIESSYSKEDKNRYEGGIKVAHKKGETKVSG